MANSNQNNVGVKVTATSCLFSYATNLFKRGE